MRDEKRWERICVSDTNIERCNSEVPIPHFPADLQSLQCAHLGNHVWLTLQITSQRKWPVVHGIFDFVCPGKTNLPFIHEKEGRFWEKLFWKLTIVYKNCVFVGIYEYTFFRKMRKAKIRSIIMILIRYNHSALWKEIGCVFTDKTSQCLKMFVKEPFWKSSPSLTSTELLAADNNIFKPDLVEQVLAFLEWLLKIGWKCHKWSLHVRFVKVKVFVVHWQIAHCLEFEIISNVFHGSGM